MVFYILFFTLSFHNLMCILYLQHISIRTGRISSTQYPHVADGCHVGWGRYRQSVVLSGQLTGLMWESSVLGNPGGDDTLKGN